MNDGTQSPDSDVYRHQLTVGSLFTGIAGLDLGLERAGMQIVWQSEIEPYCCRVLARHYPHVPNLGDITTVDWSSVERPDLVCGGFPCQPFSHAGTRRGTDDPRHLWPHMATCLRLVRPEWVLLENVPGILTLGFGQVAADLVALGYDLEWECIPAAAVGAPHLRYRLFVVAHTDRDGEHALPVDAEMASPPQPVAHTGGQRQQRWPSLQGDGRQAPIRSEEGDSTGNGGGSRDVADPDGEQLRVRTGSVLAPPGTRESERQERERVRPDVGDGSQTVADTFGPGLEVFQRQPGHNGTQLPTVERDGNGRGWWESEPDVGRVAHGVPARVDRLRALGNAVVPQVAEWVGRRIVEAAS